jgi:hypothetical protein
VAAEYAEIDELRFNFGDLDDEVMERRENDTGASRRGPDKPGAYPGEIVSMRARTAKADGSPTKDIEVIAAINDGDFDGWQGRLYINVEPEGEYYDLNQEIYYQTLNAIGLADRKKRRQGKFKLSDAEGKDCTLVVSIEADNRVGREGQKQARLSRIIKPGLSSGAATEQTAAEPAQSGGSEDLPF